MLLLQTTRLFLACLQKVSCYLYLIIGQLSAVCMFHWDVYIYLIAIISTCNQGLHNLQYFCRSRPTFWYATARWLSDSTFSVSIQYRWWTPPLIYPISTSTRYDSVCSYSLLHCSVVSFKTNSHFFFWLTFITTSVCEGNSISYLHLTICQSMYHVATIGGQNEWGKWDLQFRTHHIKHIIIFLQDLPHILVCFTQVDAGFLLLSILTVDTSHYLCHHSKVLLIYDHLVVVFMLCQATELEQP